MKGMWKRPFLAVLLALTLAAGLCEPTVLAAEASSEKATSTQEVLGKEGNNLLNSADKL